MRRYAIPDGSDARPRVTFHSLRRTYASLLAEAGADSGYTMSQIGHKSAKLTLEVYTDVGNTRHGANERLGRLLRTPGHK